MIEKTCCIIVPTNSKYIDICGNFVKVLNRSWPDCSYNLIMSVTGEDKKVEGVENLYNGSNASLIDCIVNASDKYNCDYYMIFLGDAFMCGKVDSQNVEKLLDDMRDNEIDFCCLYPEKTRMKVKKVGEQARYIHIKDRYCHCFGYILCNKKYINEMFISAGISTDLEYELWYLNKSMESKTDYYYAHDAVVTSNIFNIRCGIKKGKWDRVVHRWINKNYPDIQLAARPMLSITSQAMIILREKVLYMIPDAFRIKVKQNIVQILGKNPFDTMT